MTRTQPPRRAPAGAELCNSQYEPGHVPALGAQRDPPARRGPRGYVRSDARIHEDVCGVLWHSDGLQVEDVAVEVREAVVTLSGSVPSRSMKHRIEDLAAAAVGVIDVDNRLKVARDGAQPRTEGGDLSIGSGQAGGDGL